MLENTPIRRYIGNVSGWCLPTFFLVFCRILLFSSSVVMASPGEDIDLNPLRPADTSSPRATLHSFLSNINLAIKARRENRMTPSAFKAYRLALETMDFDTTENANTWSGRILRALLLQEVLSRVNLPPEQEIPDEKQAGSEGWTIPGTAIRIERISSGPNTGKFLFDANTVETIDAVYRRVKHLPSRAGAVKGIYESVISSDSSILAVDAKMKNRLKPVNTSNPRTTLDEFLDSVNRAYALVTKAEAGLSSHPPTMTKQQALDLETSARYFLKSASASLDLSQVPDALRNQTSVEFVLQLKEILDRSFLPPIDSIPDEQEVSAARRHEGQFFLANTGVGGLRWRLPNTRIEIAEITEGPQQGQFLFSAESLSNLGRYYDKVRDLPYRPESFGGLELEYLSPGLSPGFYQSYISTPGVLVPRAHLFSSEVDKLPEPFKVLIHEQTVWQWLALLFAVFALSLASYTIFRVTRSMAEKNKPPVNSWLMLAAPISVAVLVSFAVDFIHSGINITGDLFFVVSATGNTLVIILTAWIVFAVCAAIAETVIAAPRIEDPSPEASLIRVSASIVGLVIALWTIVRGFQNIGADLIPLIAGLGVGSLAIALAAQRTLANLLGSLILFINKPVKVGDFCRYGDQIGTVEEIGWISTRIRSLERTIVTVPNAEFSEMKLDNFAVRDERLFKTVLQLRYETTSDQIRFILVRLRELLIGHPMVTPKPARVRFVGFGSFSKDLEVFSYLRCQDQDTYLAVQEDLLLRMEDIILQAGSGFAFPSQTNYFARYTGIDAEKQKEAETQIDKLRVTGRLPFPDFDDKEREQLENAIEYPAKGCSSYRPSVKRRKTPSQDKLPDEIPDRVDSDDSKE